MKRPVITLLTDFGLADHYVACMKGVILTICPQADLVDITHQITPYSIPEAAYTLAQAWRYFPKGTIHLAVVDPGVGTGRRAIVAERAGHRFVAPDNGLLGMVLDADPKAKVREINIRRHLRGTISTTFHGRDVFAPITAQLALGLPLDKVGKVLMDTVTLDSKKPTQIRSGSWNGTVLKIDRYGNVITNLDWLSFNRIATEKFRLRIGRRTVSTFYTAYGAAPPDQAFALLGSAGYVEVSMNQSNAALFLGAKAGMRVKIALLGANQYQARL